MHPRQQSRDQCSDLNPPIIAALIISRQLVFLKAFNKYLLYTDQLQYDFSIIKLHFHTFNTEMLTVHLCCSVCCSAVLLGAFVLNWCRVCNMTGFRAARKRYRTVDAVVPRNFCCLTLLAKGLPLVSKWFTDVNAWSSHNWNKNGKLIVKQQHYGHGGALRDDFLISWIKTTRYVCFPRQCCLVQEVCFINGACLLCHTFTMAHIDSINEMLQKASLCNDSI